ncbi:hypothetical protein [Zhengella mangrovi]|uniref:hypothetical protein n=1 Tax=Zhengella mangrovi TaxID=1982044 RepID=UPI0013FE4A4F|nr:hypothetical protein [Zhengella mangrovi]
MKHTRTRKTAKKAPASKARWGDSGLSARYGKVGSGAVCAALLYAGRISGTRTRKSSF